MNSNKKREKALQALAELGELQQKAQEDYEKANDAWWDGLEEHERQDAFYAVIKRMYQAEVKDRGTYRWALYDVFGFDPSMYTAGMDCGYMALHNIIFDGLEYQQLKGVNRFEVIDDTGRALVKYLKDDERVRYMLQDDDRTLKVFIDKVHRIKADDL